MLDLGLNATANEADYFYTTFQFELNFAQARSKLQFIIKNFVTKLCTAESIQVDLTFPKERKGRRSNG